MLYRIWAILVRYIVRPFMEALSEELKEVEWKRAGRKLDGEILEQLSQMSKERLEVLLKDKLSESVVDLQAENKKHAAALRGAAKAVAELREDKVALTVELEKTNKRLLILEKQFKIQKNLPTRGVPGEAQTEILEFE